MDFWKQVGKENGTKIDPKRQPKNDWDLKASWRCLPGVLDRLGLVLGIKTESKTVRGIKNQESKTKNQKTGIKNHKKLEYSRKLNTGLTENLLRRLPALHNIGKNQFLIERFCKTTSCFLFDFSLFLLFLCPNTNNGPMLAEKNRANTIEIPRTISIKSLSKNGGY